MTRPTRPGDTWAPLYFLSSVGAGGPAVTFFMWLFHRLPHPGQTVPTFEDIDRAFGSGDGLKQAMIVAARGDRGLRLSEHQAVRLEPDPVEPLERHRSRHQAARLERRNANGGHVVPGDMLKTLTQRLSVQVVFGLLGLAVLGSLGHARRFLTGPDASVRSCALVCPGVALSVMVHFWLNKGQVGAGLVAKFGLAYWTISAVAGAFQMATILLVVMLNCRHFGAPRAAQAAPAE